MTIHSIQYRETRARLSCPRQYLDQAWETLKRCHKELRAYRERDRAFANSFHPVDCLPGAPLIARHMAAAARRAGTGPMAAVAGAIGMTVVRALVRSGARHVIFENGGDITMFLERPVTIGIYTGPGGPGDLGVRIEALAEITACCTSSGTVGHSFSFGRGDAAVVLAGDAALADATATSLGNRLRRDGLRSLTAALKNTPRKGIHAMLAVMKGCAAGIGDPAPWVKTAGFTLPEECEVARETA